MPSLNKIRICFFIGPMKDMPRMLAFRDGVLKDLLAGYGFTVETPDAGDIGNVMQQVLLGLEQADLLIADITGNNPNVLYELGVYHAFGKPYLAIKEEATGDNKIETPFDIAQYRFHEINFGDKAKAISQLKPKLDAIIQNIDALPWFGNPVTDFYKSPIAEIPTAIGLFKNYKKNFLEMLLPEVFQKDYEENRYRVNVYEEKMEDGKPVSRAWTPEERDALTIELRIPARLNMTSHKYLEGLKSTGQLKLKSAKLQKPNRPFSISYDTDAAGNKVIVDIPTILSTLNESIEARRKAHGNSFPNADWLTLEQQELERFTQRCQLFKEDLEKDHPECKNKLRISSGVEL